MKSKTKHRIKKVIHGDGTETFYIQTRWLFTWQYWAPGDSSCVGYPTLEAAKNDWLKYGPDKKTEIAETY